jgi:hypothetical protein
MSNRVASEEIKHLRERAERFRRLGIDLHTPVSWRLLDIADEFERRAKKLEQRRSSA